MSRQAARPKARIGSRLSKRRFENEPPAHQSPEHMFTYVMSSERHQERPGQAAPAPQQRHEAQVARPETGVQESSPWRDENSVSRTNGWSRRRKSAPCGGYAGSHLP